MKIAWFTPFAPRSAIGDYSEVVAGRLAESCDVTLIVPGEREANEPRPSDLPMWRIPDEPPPEVLASLAGFDLCVYNLGNFVPYHRAVYEVSRRHAGVVILHDLVMRDFFLALFVHERHDAPAFVRHALRDHGPAAAARARGAVDGTRPEVMGDPDRLTDAMFPSALDGCRGAIVHSDYARRRVAEALTVPLAQLDFPMFGPCRTFESGVPEKTPDPDGKVRLLTFGVVNETKLIHATIRAIARSAFLREHVRFTVIGGTGGAPQELRYLDRLRDMIRDADLEDVIELAGRRPDDELNRHLADADVVVNLRFPHTGESSASLAAALVAGACTVVWDNGYYGEFPDDVVRKISAESQLGPALEELVRDADQRRALGRAARAHALERFDTDRYCEAFLEFAAEICARGPTDRLADVVAGHLAEMGRPPGDPLVDQVAAEIAALWGDREPAA